jgi:hypothetical protein
MPPVEIARRSAVVVKSVWRVWARSDTLVMKALLEMGHVSSTSILPAALPLVWADDSSVSYAKVDAYGDRQLGIDSTISL